MNSIFVTTRAISLLANETTGKLEENLKPSKFKDFENN
jgi:hypothetical protein